MENCTTVHTCHQYNWEQQNSSKIWFKHRQLPFNCSIKQSRVYNYYSYTGEIGLLQKKTVKINLFSTIAKSETRNLRYLLFQAHNVIGLSINWLIDWLNLQLESSGNDLRDAVSSYAGKTVLTTGGGRSARVL